MNPEHRRFSAEEIQSGVWVCFLSASISLPREGGLQGEEGRGARGRGRESEGRERRGGGREKRRGIEMCLEKSGTDVMQSKLESEIIRPVCADEIEWQSMYANID